MMNRHTETFTADIVAPEPASPGLSQIRLRPSSQAPLFTRAMVTFVFVASLISLGIFGTLFVQQIARAEHRLMVEARV